jgi:hypothetical protein
VRAMERSTPVAAVVAALTSLACCLPLSFLGAGLAGALAWTGAYRDWFLALAVILLVAGFVQIYRGRRQCRKRSVLSLALFWVSAAFVLVILFFPQVIASLLAG